jgi:hypothetical protein
MADPRRPRPNAPGTRVPLPSLSPPPESDPPPSPPPSHTTALLRENAQLRDGMRRYHQILEEKRLRSIAPGGGHARQMVPQWAAGLVAVIAALGAAGAFKVIETMTAKPTVKPAELQQKDEDSRARDTAVLDYLSGLDQDERRRNQITIDVLCAVNGGPPAGKVKCRENACEPRALQDGKIVPGQPICKSKLEWPTRRQPPKPRPPTPTEDEEQ